MQLSLEDVLFSMPDAYYGLAGVLTVDDRQDHRMADGWLERKLDVRTVLDLNYTRNLYSVFDSSSACVRSASIAGQMDAFMRSLL